MLSVGTGRMLYVIDDVGEGVLTVGKTHSTGPFLLQPLPDMVSERFAGGADAGTGNDGGYQRG